MSNRAPALLRRAFFRVVIPRGSASSPAPGVKEEKKRVEEEGAVLKKEVKAAQAARVVLARAYDGEKREVQLKEREDNRGSADEDTELRALVLAHTGNPFLDPHVLQAEDKDKLAGGGPQYCALDNKGLQ
jgi:hypothetical protein